MYLLQSDFFLNRVISEQICWSNLEEEHREFNPSMDKWAHAQ